MALYTTQTGKLKEVKEKPFKLEKDIQKVFEANLSALMGLELVKSEFTIKNKRIDTLAYDAQGCAFIIIEYERDKNISVVDQYNTTDKNYLLVHCICIDHRNTTSTTTITGR